MQREWMDCRFGSPVPLAYRVLVPKGRVYPGYSHSPAGKRKSAGTPYVPRDSGFFVLASLRGLEPPAYRLGGGRSIQLSYRDIYKRLYA